jgi:hypothetical protein
MPKAVPSLLLDLFPNAAVAYSLRKLRTAYTGSAIRVRRSSDNAEQDIGFVGGDLDTASLLTFCGAGNGFVTTWYDQSTNGNNATQTTAGNQPQIVSLGVVDLQNSKPAMIFNGTSNRLNLNVISSTEVSIISVSTHTVTSAIRTIIGVGLNNGYALITDSNKYNFFYRNIADQRTVNNAISTQALIFAYTKPNVLQTLHANSILFQNIIPPNMLTPTTSARIGAYDNVSGLYNGNQQELIIYTSDQSTNRTAIETNINSHYNIYP